MLVQLETQLIWYGREYSPGEAIDLPDADATRMLERGMASMPPSEPIIETAAINYKPRGKHARNTSTR